MPDQTSELFTTAAPWPLQGNVFNNRNETLMNRKTNPNPKTVAAEKPKGKASTRAAAKTRAATNKASSRKTKQADAPHHQAQQRPACVSRTVQLHQCNGICVVFLDADKAITGDPQFKDRFRNALQTTNIRLCFSTETDAYDFELTPFYLESPDAEEGGEGQAPVEADKGNEGVVSR
ncbi:MAG TPA: hypothetical protein DCY64_03850 [Hydrogenophaga sp.]|nr:MAG: hypothetical protein A2X73_03315 [Burkholderiales bacterium GWE1_65_30]OGA93524.1 MAG: hypothetical protein A2X72_20890 [Burkholderiales bacterium GWF1_66_17]HAX19399.1 hypothetical protein [Hydrogenophaga sp.]HBU18720.1 hypothetical protein [Hydrogenophaga sp.]